MVDSINANVKVGEVVQQPEEEGKQQYNISYRGSDYERTPESDSFESENKNKTGKTIGIITAVVAVLAGAGAIFVTHRGKNVLNKSDATLKEKFEAGWNDIFKKGEKGVKDAENKVNNGTDSAAEAEDAAKAEDVAKGKGGESAKHKEETPTPETPEPTAGLQEHAEPPTPSTPEPKAETPKHTEPPTPTTPPTTEPKAETPKAVTPKETPTSAKPQTPPTPEPTAKEKPAKQPVASEEAPKPVVQTEPVNDAEITNGKVYKMTDTNNSKLFNKKDYPRTVEIMENGQKLTVKESIAECSDGSQYLRKEFYNSKDQIVREEISKNGRPDEIDFIFYYKNGTVEKTVYYSNGRPRSAKYADGSTQYYKFDENKQEWVCGEIIKPEKATFD